MGLTFDSVHCCTAAEQIARMAVCISCIAHHSDMSVAQFIIGLLAVFGQSYFSGITPDITSFPLQISQILGTAYEPHKVQQYVRFKQGNMIEICDGAIFNF